MAIKHRIDQHSVYKRDLVENYIVDATDNAAAGAAAYEEYPTTMIGNVLLPIPMDAGWYVKITCGAAQGAAAEASCIVLEFDA